MTVGELYNAWNKSKDENWHMSIAVDVSYLKKCFSKTSDAAMNVLAYCNSYYDVEGTKNKGDGFFDEPYSVKELFDREVEFFTVGYGGLYVTIVPWDGMKVSAGILHLEKK